MGAVVRREICSVCGHGWPCDRHDGSPLNGSPESFGPHRFSQRILSGRVFCGTCGVAAATLRADAALEELHYGNVNAARTPQVPRERHEIDAAREAVREARRREREATT